MTSTAISDPHHFEIIDEPTQNDILCGKEKHCLRHPGSRRFRQTVESYQGLYERALTKTDKMNITREILANLSSNSARFLKFNTEANGWEELTQIAARDKISHALRNLRSRKKRKKKHERTRSDLTILTNTSRDTIYSSTTTSQGAEEEEGELDDSAVPSPAHAPPVGGSVNRNQQNENSFEPFPFDFLTENLSDESAVGDLADF